MSTTATAPRPPGTPAAGRANYLDVETTVRSWLGTTDHKRIGILFLLGTTAALALGGSFAIAMRLELITPEPLFMDDLTYNRLFTLHGVVMVWLFMIPAIPTVFGNFMLPLMIGARDVAFPRLNLASFYVYLAGAIVVLGGILASGADTGWTFYPPYSTTTPTAVVPILLGVFILGISSTMTGINFIVTTHTLRTAGMHWSRLPLFIWTVYATSIIIVLATPVLGVTLLLVAADHALGLGMFDPAHGGDPILFQHIFWFYSHPAVYIMILPAMGVITESVATFARKNLFSYGAMVVATLGIAFIGFLTWGHHMFTAGMSTFDVAAFGALSMFVAIFSAIKVFNWVATLYGGAIAVSVPLLYVFGFLFLFSVGGMTGVAQASTSLDVHWHDTYFIVAHFHFIMVGGTMMAYLAALHYWFPKMFGRRYPERWALAATMLVIGGFVLTFSPQFWLGNAGMPRRYHTYPAQYQALHVISTAGSWAIAGGLVMTLVYLIVSLRRGRPAGPNPWGSASFEWLTPSPPPRENYAAPPQIDRGPYDYRPPRGPEDGGGHE